MKILIFSSSAGNGHNSTANRIKEKDATLYAFTDIKEIQNMMLML